MRLSGPGGSKHGVSSPASTRRDRTTGETHPLSRKEAGGQVGRRRQQRGRSERRRGAPGAADPRAPPPGRAGSPATTLNKLWRRLFVSVSVDWASSSSSSYVRRGGRSSHGRPPLLLLLLLLISASSGPPLEPNQAEVDAVGVPPSKLEAEGVGVADELDDEPGEKGMRLGVEEAGRGGVGVLVVAVAGGRPPFPPPSFLLPAAMRSQSDNEPNRSNGGKLQSFSPRDPTRRRWRRRRRSRCRQAGWH